MRIRKVRKSRVRGEFKTKMLAPPQREAFLKRFLESKRMLAGEWAAKQAVRRAQLYYGGLEKKVGVGPKPPKGKAAEAVFKARMYLESEKLPVIKPGKVPGTYEFITSAGPITLTLMPKKKSIKK